MDRSEVPLSAGRPGEPTVAQVEATRAWLARHGVRVTSPTRLLTVRIGARRACGFRRPWLWQMGGMLVAILLAAAYQCLQYLPDVRGVEMTESKILYFMTGTTSVGAWLGMRRRERAFGRLPVYRVRDPHRQSWRRLLGGWYLASLLITFGGGAALAVTIYFTTPARTYAWSWLGALGWAALCCLVILVGTLRAPVIAEDEASAAVDTMLRIEDIQLSLPACFAPPILVDLATTNRQPREFTLRLVVYAAAARSTAALGALRHRRRSNLPIGYCGSPCPPQPPSGAEIATTGVTPESGSGFLP